MDPYVAGPGDLYVEEGYVVGGSFVVSDATLKNRLFSPADVLDRIVNANAPGWTDWVQFLVGDYEYQKAAFKIDMRGNGSQRIAMMSCNLTVDVPDTLNRGTAVIATAGEHLRIDFARPYHVLPEISAAVVSAPGPCYVKIISRDTNGFVATILSSADNSDATGTFSWNAAAY